jgi:hypothetical protein
MSIEELLADKTDKQKSRWLSEEIKKTEAYLRHLLQISRKLSEPTIIKSNGRIKV